MIAGLSNVYTHYVTTYEEYQVQRYEGSSTIYGPHTLLAYQQQYSYLMKKLMQVFIQEGKTVSMRKLDRYYFQKERVPYLANPPNYKSKQIRLDTGMFLDLIPPGKTAGECVQKPPKFVHPGQTVIVK